MPELIPGLVTVVTPCLNAATFIDETIASILRQTYASVEHIVIDGGSTDDTIERARTYGARVEVVELPGSSQASAINHGLQRARGEFFTFLNADDVLEDDAIERMVAALRANPSAPYVYGDGTFIDEQGAAIGTYPTQAFSAQALMQTCFICQPATLLRTNALRAAGGVDERYHAAFDYDLWIRLCKAQPPPVRIEHVVARARMHRDAKTFRSRPANLHEILLLVRRHYGYVPFTWIHAYAGLLTSPNDQFFEPPVGTPKRALMTLLIGLRENPRRVVRFAGEFASEMTRLHRNPANTRHS